MKDTNFVSSSNANLMKFETLKDFLIYETKKNTYSSSYKNCNETFYRPSREKHARFIYLHKPQIPWRTCDSVSAYTGARPCDIFTNCQSSIAVRQIASNEAVARACLRPVLSALRMEIVVVDAAAVAAAKKPIEQSKDSFALIIHISCGSF